MITRKRKWRLPILLARLENKQGTLATYLIDAAETGCPPVTCTWRIFGASGVGGGIPFRCRGWHPVRTLATYLLDAAATGCPPLHLVSLSAQSVNWLDKIGQMVFGGRQRRFGSHTQHPPREVGGCWRWVRDERTGARTRRGHWPHSFSTRPKRGASP